METDLHIAIADDHAVVREGLKALINLQPDMEVIFEAADGVELLEKIQVQQPHILTLDIQMPQSDPVDLISHVKRFSSITRIIILSMYNDAFHVQSTLSAGSHGYLTKSAVPTVLIDAIRKVHAGDTYLDTSLRAEIDHATLPKNAKLVSKDSSLPLLSLLSQREKEILTFLAKGYTHREISTQLNISINTVGSYRNRLSEKLNMKTRVEFTTFATKVFLI